jgi:hypothetical protein
MMLSTFARRVTCHVIATSVALGIVAWSVVAAADVAVGEQAAPGPQMDPTCPAQLKDDVLAALWKRRPAAPPTRGAPSVMIRYRNEYGRAADALVFALDGVAVKLKCNAEESAEGLVFDGPLKPGVHHLDTVFDFGTTKGGRGGRTALTFKVKAGSSQRLVVVFNRNGEEWPVAYIDSAKP